MFSISIYCFTALVTNPISASASASDYVVQATGTILAGDPCTTVTISITDDLVQEPSEQFVVTLTSVITGNAIINSSFNTFTVTVSESDIGKLQIRSRISVTLKSRGILFVTFQT